ncbi:UTRA domain-containing protein [Xanthomonas hortorum]|uniref:UTRA domain-containing protein n=1 Tax=Xanthomonas hortorum TaxID=56454 RepID=UPI001592F5DA|nr:UTRA domain-containing protein [Xanthomonas hortorum]NHF67845.1 UTRA domain-containing protein [Xanthomonas hortorum]
MSVSRQHAITEIISAQIAAGEWGPDQRLPVERELAERFACTRITLREALQQLEAQGRIYRENRRGWFVSAPRVRYDPTSIAGFMQYVAAQGRKPRTELLSATRQAAGAAYAAALRLETPYDEVFVLQRRRWIDRRAVLLETNVVLAAWAPGLLEHDLAGSLSSVFNQKLGLFLSRAHVSMHPAGLDATQAMLLQSTTGTPCFRLQRVSFAEDGRAVELDIESWRHDALDVVVRTEAPTRSAS